MVATDFDIRPTSRPSKRPFRQQVPKGWKPLPKSDRKSRAVTRPIEAGNSAICASCDEPVKFAARNKAFQVIANVYENGKWNRVEHYHAECYEAAGEPYGTAA